MIYDMQPSYHFGIVLPVPFDNDKKYYYTLYAKRRNVIVDDQEVVEDDCMIAFSDGPKHEIINYRNKLIHDGIYRPLDLYVQKVFNSNYKRS
jgi:hypothetical protein